jgi:hypothetical protein
MTKKKRITECKKVLKNLSKNYWAVSTVVLAILLIAVLAVGGIGGSSDVSEDTIRSNILSFIEKQGGEIELGEITDEGSFYQVAIEGEEGGSIFVTKDGNFVIQPQVELVTQAAPTQAAPTQTPAPAPTPTNIPKTDKPKVELFVMSHCPFGTQAEKGMLPVAGLLGDKIDFEISFVYYAMHPTYGEPEEQLNQYCIQEEQNDKYLDYLTCFLEAGDGEGCIDSTGIDKKKLASCYKASDAKFEMTKNIEDKTLWLKDRAGDPSYPLFNTHKEANEAYGVGGSPTLIVNGVKAQAGRDSASYLNAVCAAFNVAPEECDEVLPSDQPTSGFGWSTTQAAATAATCG